MRHPLKVWRDPANRLSPLRIITLACLIAPFIKALVDADDIIHSARPIDNLIHRAGYWTIIFLLVALAVTPLRRIAQFNQLVDVRRMIGVGAFFYAATHILLFTADQMFDLTKVASEIIFRIYLTIGFVALLGLTALAVTSTDGMVRRLGVKRWQTLHQAVYVIAGLALIHFFQQNKADVWVPTFAAGLFGWLIGYRLLVKWRKSRDEPPAWMLFALTVTMSALTFICESVGIGIVFKVSPLRVLQTSFDFDFDMIRPGWLVLGAGLCVVVLDLVRARFAKRRRASRPAKVTVAAGKPAA
ncbi:MAG TPA: protein-methionine-sulfoxide reductase heme-binding subunit MsrQ [Steroidobacteraceae bacterium]|nr:protein-methionine-sulfoxide reductase heme-binding subunit MsrQ [Steroidobacteraceae bacterium]